MKLKDIKTINDLKLYLEKNFKESVCYDVSALSMLLLYAKNDR